MKLLLTTTAMSFALGTTNLAVASVHFTPVEAVRQLEIVLAPNFYNAVSLTTETETFYQGDILVCSRAKLEGLTQADLYVGEGAVEASNLRYVT